MSEKRGPEYMPYDEWAVLDAARQKRLGRLRGVTAAVTFVVLCILFAYPLSKRIETITQLQKALRECDQTQATVALLNPDGTPFQTRLVEDNLAGARRVDLENGTVIIAFDGQTKFRFESVTKVFQTQSEDTETFTRPPRERLARLIRSMDGIANAAQCRFNSDGSFEFDRKTQRYLVRPGTGDTLAYVRISTHYDDSYLPLAEWTISRAKSDIERFRIKPPSDAKVVTADIDNIDPIQKFPHHVNLLSVQLNRDGDMFVLERYREPSFYATPDGEPAVYIPARRRFDWPAPDGSTIASRMGYRKRLIPVKWPYQLNLEVQIGDEFKVGMINKLFKEPSCLMIPDYEFSIISDIPYNDFYLRTLVWGGSEADTGNAPNYVGRPTNPVINGQVGIENYHRALALATLFDDLMYTDQDRIFYALCRCYKAVGASDSALKAAKEGLSRSPADPFFSQVFTDAIEELEP